LATTLLQGHYMMPAGLFNYMCQKGYDVMSATQLNYYTAGRDMIQC